MERESVQHSPRLDDEMAHEIDSMTRGGSNEESRTREDRVIEEPTEDDVGSPTRRSAGTIFDLRSELARHVTAAQWPAEKSQLVDVAHGDAAPQVILDSLRRLPDGERFENVQEVWAALGGPIEPGHTGTRQDG
jgi:hypothetical protein